MTDQELTTTTGGPEIAVIGMAGRFPGAHDLDAFWANLRDGIESVSFSSDADLLAAGVDPALLSDPRYVRAGARIDDPERFDAAFFGFYPREAEVMDPQHRLFLECAWTALEHAGYDAQRYPGLIGVFGGAGMNTYLLFNVLPNPAAQENVQDYQITIANDKDFLPTRVSYKLNLRGPSVNVQTACSTSLVAVHMACQSLLSYQADMALAGGAALRAPQERGYAYREGGILAPDGHCRAFDANAGGTVPGNGVGVVVLKRLEDAIADGDTIHALIKATAINNDGANKVGYTAPGVDGQADVIATAQAIAGVEPESISYIEAHGTGTALGDPIEIAALSQVFAPANLPPGTVAIGSLKTNVGHMDAAAGVAGLIKTVLALKHRQLPPSLHFERPNPAINFEHTPFFVNATLRDWKTNRGPRRAGVSSFGIGGTNAHVVLEEAPELMPGDLGRDQHMLVLSAKTATALEQAAANLAAHLRAHPEQPLADVAYTLQIGRQQFAHRLALVCHDAAEAATALEALDPRRVLVGEAEDVRPLAFLFTGQGAQYVGMARELYAGEPLFREQVDYCAELLRPHLGLDLRELIFDSVRPETLNETRYTQPALFVIEYATAQLLISWGLQPQAMIGHSIGEYVAACLAGVFSLEDALVLVAARGRLMQQMPAGTMLSVQLGEAELRRRLLPGVELAAINAPELCVVAGPDEAITAFESRLSADGIGCRRLHTSHAFHTAMMDPVIAPFAALVDRLTLNPPTIPFLSNLSGNWITADEATDPHYWARHLRQGVRFADGLSALFAGQPMALIEVGPGQTLATFARQHPQSRGHAILATLPGPRDPARADAMMLGALGRLWLLGVPVDWVAFSAGERRLRVPLPTYPFERERYWLSPLLFDVTPRRGALRKRPDITDWFYTPSWRRVSLAVDRAVLAPGASERWLVLSECNIGSGLADSLATEGAEVVTVRLGDRFAQLEPGMFSLNPLCRADYDLLLDAMGANLPSHILYTWSLSEQRSAGRRDLLALTYLAQVLASRAAKPTRIVVLTAGAHEVAGTEDLNPHAAMLPGLSRVIGQEFSQLRCRCIDLNPGELLNEQLLGQLRVDLRADVGIAPVAYRAGQRWVESFEPARLATLDLPALPRTGGVYLITGGLGRVGLVLAATLARAGVGALVLTGRTALPDRSDWAQWLTLYGEHDRVSRSIRGVQALEALGVQVLSAQADAASYEQMAAVLSKALQHFGAVHGLIHAAGLVGTASLRMLNELNEAQCEALLHAKVEGALVLARLAQEYQPDFVLLISSLAAVAGGMGMGTYAAANRFLDTLARKQSQSGDIPWISIGWDGWNFGDLPMGGAGASLAMTPAEGSEAFWRALGWQVGPQLLVSTGDLLARLEPPAPVAAESPTVLHARPRLRTGYVAPSGEVELTIAALWEQVLGIGQIGIYDDFFELGGHSLLATQMISRLRERYNVELPLRNLFDAPTVAGLAALIAAGQAQALAPASPAIIRLPRERALPLSHIQQRMWFLDQLEPGSPLYNNPGAVRLRGALDLAALERSLVEIVRRHEVLRTTFGEEDGQPLPVVASVEAAAHIALLQLSDLSGLPESAREVELQRLAQAEAQAPFDLARGPLLRLALLRLAADDHVALLTMHHIVSDGWSLGVFIRELGALYAAFTTGQPSPLPELSVQYADVAAWQREILEQPGADGVSLREVQSDYWRRELGGDLPALELPTDRPRPQMQSFRGAMRWFNLPRQLNDAVAELCRREDVTPFMALLAAFEALLHRYTGQSCFGVGTPIAGRTRTEAEPLIGIFVNTLVLRADLDAELSFRELLRQVRERALGAYANQELPFEMLVDALQPERSLSHTPLFQVMFVLQNAPMQAIALPGLSIAPLEVDSGTAKFDLTLSVEESAQGYRGWLNYNADLFDAATMDRLLDHFALLLAGACAEPSQPIAMLPLLTEAEQQILAAWNATDSGDLPAPLVHQVIARQAVLTPDAIAVVGDDPDGLRLSYRELDARANQLAHYLRGMGVGPEHLVGLCVERTPLMLVGLLGILKAGGGYLPLDPGYPVERLRFMIEDAAPAVLLTTLSAQAGLADIEQLTAAPQLVRLDADWPVIADQPERAPEELVRPESLAYVIYTSGSTGTPKGVVIEQQSLADHCRDMARFYELSSADRVLQFASFNFDASIEQILPTLMAGARLVLRGDEVWSSAEFYRQITEQQLTVINPPTAYWHQLVQDWADGPQAQAPTSLRLVIVGGDALRPESLQLRAKTSLRSLRLLNAYGPTETTITATTYEVPAELPPDLLRVPIGRPLANRRAFVLDRQGSLVPIGVAGELYLGGLGVARGYLNRPELTAERFVEREGMRLYRTGDLVRYLSDGNIEFLGRVDQQVKLRGFRIELGEIEAVLGQHPAVRGVIVLAREDTPGDKRLVAYVLAQPDTPADGASLRAYLSQRLPDYMLPSAFVILDAFPLTPSGKVDRRALPAPDAARPELIERYVAPRNPIEAEIATAWADVLGLEQIGIHDNFFELGGHSLLATRLVSRLRSFFHVDLPLRSLFETPTVAGIAIAIAQAQADQTDDDELAALLAELEELSDEEASHQLATERGGPTD